MDRLLSNIDIKVNEKIFVADPSHSDLGKRILLKAAPLIVDVGFEHFNFKKLSKEIDATEAAVYRYFENKHKLLLFYFSWYWQWLEYNLVFRTQNLSSPKSKLGVIIDLVLNVPDFRGGLSYMNPDALFLLMQGEGWRVPLTLLNDKDQKEYLLSYVSVSGRIQETIKEHSPDYPYGLQIATSIMMKPHFEPILRPYFPEQPKDGKKQMRLYLNDLINRIAKGEG